MDIDKNTVFINHDVEGRQECLGLIITEGDGGDLITNVVASKAGCTYAGAGALKGGVRTRGYVWTRGKDIKNEVHIISVNFLTKLMLENLPLNPW